MQSSALRPTCPGSFGSPHTAVTRCVWPLRVPTTSAAAVLYILTSFAHGTASNRPSAVATAAWSDERGPPPLSNDMITRNHPSDRLNALSKPPPSGFPRCGASLERKACTAPSRTLEPQCPDEIPKSLASFLVFRYPSPRVYPRVHKVAKKGSIVAKSLGRGSPPLHDDTSSAHQSFGSPQSHSRK